MHNLAEIICAEFGAPEGRNLQERCLESLILMERFIGRNAPIEVAPSTAAADIGPEIIARLADALASFIRAFPYHPDVGAAIGALGRLGDPRFSSLFEQVLSCSGGYSELARHQARVVLVDDLGHSTAAPA